LVHCPWLNPHERALLATTLRIRRGTLLVYLRQVDCMAEGGPVMPSHEHHLASAFEITVRRKGPWLAEGRGQVIAFIIM
jgi:hypothetical protein